MSKFGPRLPDFIVIGAMKGGTTSLNAYLAAHPQITVPPAKEIHFFNKYWDRGTGWYARYFSGNGEVCGESTPEYSKYPVVPAIPQRIKSVLPHVKLIYAIRDPVERLKSHYLQSVIKGFETNPIDSAVQKDGFKNEYVYASRYYFQLQQYLSFFPAQNIYVLPSEDMRNHRIQALREVFSFLGVDPGFESEVFFQTFNETKNRRRPSYAGKLILNAYESIANLMFDHVSDHWLFLTRLSQYPVIKWLKRKLTREVEPLQISPSVLNALKDIFIDDTIEMEKFIAKKLNWFSDI